MPTLQFKTNAALVARRMLHRSQAIRVNLDKANRETLEDALKIAKGFSNARAYNPRLDKSRPYSRRFPHPRLPAFLVNKQSGEFERGWKTRYQGSGLMFRGTLYNDSSRAAFFTGEPTKTMIGRPIIQAVNKTILGKRRAAMRKAVRDGLRQI